MILRLSGDRVIFWAVNFYENPIPADRFIQEGEHDYLYGLAFTYLNMIPGYEEVSTRLLYGVGPYGPNR